MYGKYMVSGGGRPVEYIVNNGSNSMRALFFSRMDSRIVCGRLLEPLWGLFLRGVGGRGPIFEVFEHSENHVKFWTATKEGRASF